MRRLVPVLLLVAATASGQTVPPVEITVHGYKFVRQQRDLVSRCGADPNIRGCTRFFGRKITGSCSLSNDAWAIAATAQYGMLTFAWDKRIIGHEFAHINEIRFAVEDYVNDIRALRFASLDDCTRVLHNATRSFPTVMDLLQWGSNSKRHMTASLPARFARDGVEEPLLVPERGALVEPAQSLIGARAKRGVAGDLSTELVGKRGIRLEHLFRERFDHIRLGVLRALQDGVQKTPLEK
jgi:hypothetical protein